VGTPVQRSLATGYDNVGNVTRQADGLGHTVTSVYDKVNRRTEVHDALDHVTTTAYDKVGNATQVTDPLSKNTQYAFDGRNRPVAVTDPLGHTTTTVRDADGNAAATADALGDVGVSIYDPLDRPAGAVDARGAAQLTLYDAAGNRAAVIDPDGNQTTFVLDALDRQVLRTDAAGKTTTVAYDSAGRLTSITDRDSRQRSFSYDSADRLTGSTWLSPTGATVNVLTYTYDNTGNVLTASDYHGTVSAGYDELGRQTGRTDVFGLTLTYSYDPADRRTLVQDSKGGNVTSVYDNADRLTSRQYSDGTNTVRVDLGYSDRNQLTGISRYSNLTGGSANLVGTTSYVYDDAGRVTSVVHKNGTGATLSSYNTSYDNADRATADTGPSGTRNYSYDAADQLLTDGTSTYSYELAGNRTQVQTATTTYLYQTGTGNRLSTDGLWSYTYDAEGNLTGKQSRSSAEVWTYGYDNLNRLTSAGQKLDGVTTTFTVSYTYDALGERVQEDRWRLSTGTVTTKYAYDGLNVWADLDGSNTLKVRYLYGYGVDQPLARIVPGAGSNPVVAYLGDRLGSVRDLMGWASQAVLDHLDYDGFGQVTESNVANGDRYKYTGREWDSDTGLQDNRERRYRPSTGSWTSEDPSGFLAGDTNLYRYVRNQPVNATAPFGLRDQPS
jgi:RHS repeat-associated protein